MGSLVDYRLVIVVIFLRNEIYTNFVYKMSSVCLIFNIISQKLDESKLKSLFVKLQFYKNCHYLKQLLTS